MVRNILWPADSKDAIKVIFAKIKNIEKIFQILSP